MRALPTLAATFAAAVLLSAPAVADDEGWLSLFDGKTLAGWKAAESPASFRVEDGAIACDGPKAHLFYVGADGTAAFEKQAGRAAVSVLQSQSILSLAPATLQSLSDIGKDSCGFDPALTRADPHIRSERGPLRCAAWPPS